MSGEEAHEKGREGARRAKLWLDATTRADTRWVNPDAVAIPKLTFEWKDGSKPFSFDIGGVLLGGELDNQEFLAECKNYAKAQDQGTLFVEFLAKCYVAREARPDRAENLMYITWAPFRASDWDTLCGEDEIRKALLKHSAKALGEKDPKKAEKLITASIVTEVSQRLWLLVLSEKQEKHLVLSKGHLGVIRNHMAVSA